MTSRRNYDGGYGGGGFLGRMFSSWRQPSVKTTERFGTEGQWAVPVLEVVGAASCLVLLGLALWVLGLTVHPNHLWAAVTLAGSVVAFVFGVLGFVDLGRRQYEGLADYWVVFAYGMTASFSAGLIVYVLSTVDHLDWWLAGWDPRLLNVVRIAALGVLGGAGAGAYRFIKELIDPFELTGLDRVLKYFIERYGGQYVEAELGSMGYAVEPLKQRIGELEKELWAAYSEAPPPLVRTDRTEGRLERAALSYRLAVMAFLFTGAAGDGFSRRTWVGRGLPVFVNGEPFTVTDGMWRFWCSEGGELRREKCPVLAKAGNKVVLNPQYPPSVLAEMASNVKVPERMAEGWV